MKWLFSFQNLLNSNYNTLRTCQSTPLICLVPKLRGSIWRSETSCLWVLQCRKINEEALLLFLVFVDFSGAAYLSRVSKKNLFDLSKDFHWGTFLCLWKFLVTKNLGIKGLDFPWQFLVQVFSHSTELFRKGRFWCLWVLAYVWHRLPSHASKLYAGWNKLRKNWKLCCDPGKKWFNNDKKLITSFKNNNNTYKN